jgi:ferredoxin
MITILMIDVKDCSDAMEEVMHVTVDRARCDGHGVCQMSVPEVFELSADDGLADVLLDPIPSEFQAGAQLAADECPERAITILD